MIEQYFRDFLSGDADITHRVADRIRPGRLRQADRGDAIVLQEVSRNPAYALSGEAGKHDVVLQVKCYSDTPEGAYSLADLVRNRMSGYRGNIGQQDERQVESVRIIASGADEESLDDASDQYRFSCRWDFALFVTESIPTFL